MNVDSLSVSFSNSLYYNVFELNVKLTMQQKHRRGEIFFARLKTNDCFLRANDYSPLVHCHNSGNKS